MRELRPYQHDGIAFSRSVPNSGLFSDMGTGKTAMALHLLLTMAKPVLLVGPIRVIECTWKDEATEWPDCSGLKLSLVRGTPAERLTALQVKADVYLTNPEQVEWVVANTVMTRFKSLLIDESQMYKNPSTKRFKLMRTLRKNFTNILLLTGTPSPNSLLDFWSQIFLLDGGKRLGTSYYRYREKYFKPIDYNEYIWRPIPGALEEITKLISDIVYRIDAKDFLPPRTVIHNVIKFNMPKEAKAQYRKLEQDSFLQLGDSDITASNVVAGLMKLRQMASGLVYANGGKVVEIHDEKINILKTIIEETNSPIIVMYQFQHELKSLMKHFPQGKVLASELVTPWNQGKVPLMFINPQSGGHGLNLQFGGHTMVIYSPSFSYEHMAQTMARIDRSGQEFPVTFHKLLAVGTVEELVYAVLDSKQRSQDSALDHIKQYIRSHK